MDQETYKILIVEDSIFNQAVLAHILQTDQAASGIQQSYYDIVTAQSGMEALEKILSDKPDLVLLDIVLPGMSGFDVLVEMKERFGAQSPPVIIISGLSAEKDEEMGLSLGAVDYIAKPFKHSIILARIKTHLKIVEQMRIIEKHSMVDVLTGLSNRRSFDRQLSLEWSRAIRESTPLGLLMIDVDSFKIFNDLYGHQQGDVALQSVSDAIRTTLKRPNDFCARWGGEEFAVILPNTNLEGAMYVGELIRLSIENSVVPGIGGNPSLRVSSSVGVNSVIPLRNSLMDDFIAQADKALYLAKESGKNQVRSMS